MRSDGAAIAAAGMMAVIAAIMAVAGMAGSIAAIAEAGTGHAINRTAGAAAMAGMGRDAGLSGGTGTGCVSAADARTGGRSGARRFGGRSSLGIRNSVPELLSFEGVLAMEKCRGSVFFRPAVNNTANFYSVEVASAE